MDFVFEEAVNLMIDHILAAEIQNVVTKYVEEANRTGGVLEFGKMAQDLRSLDAHYYDTVLFPIVWEHLLPDTHYHDTVLYSKVRENVL